MAESLSERETRVGFGTAVRRGLARVCPRCGRGRLFRGLFRMETRCGHCAFSYQRGPGYFLGSTYVNYGMTAGLVTAAYVLLHFAGGLSNRVLIPVLAAFSVLFPLFFFSFARSLWLNLDCFLDPGSSAEGVEIPSVGEADENRKKPEATG